jgi:hypothetical protein
MKNAELDAKILRLSSMDALKATILSDGMVLASTNRIVKISRAETNLYAMNRAGEQLVAGVRPRNFQQQTNLTINN